MPIHDWTRVTAGIFHAFHVQWIGEFAGALNGGVLPEGYYALAEQVAGGPVPDVLALHDRDELEALDDSSPLDGPGLAVAEAPPKVTLIVEGSEAAVLASRRRRIAIRHTTGDRIIAFIEIVSPGNVESHFAADAFVDKAMESLRQGIHLLILELIPPTGVAPSGVCGLTFERSIGRGYNPPGDCPLTLAAFAAGETVAAYVEPISVGKTLVDMPLFLNVDHYVNVPLEATYAAAYAKMPERWRKVIEGRHT